jgi:hypothetical protein
MRLRDRAAVLSVLMYAHLIGVAVGFFQYGYPLIWNTCDGSSFFENRVIFAPRAKEPKLVWLLSEPIVIGDRTSNHELLFTRFHPLLRHSSKDGSDWSWNSGNYGIPIERIPEHLNSGSLIPWRRRNGFEKNGMNFHYHSLSWNMSRIKDGYGNCLLCGIKSRSSSNDISSFRHMERISSCIGRTLSRIGGFDRRPGLGNSLLLRSVELVHANVQVLISNLNGVGAGFSGSPHLFQLAQIDAGDYGVDYQRGYSNANQPPLSSPYTPKLAGCGLIIYGIGISGWWCLVCGRPRWGESRRWGYWSAACGPALVLFWQGWSLLLGI